MLYLKIEMLYNISLIVYMKKIYTIDDIYELPEGVKKSSN